MRATNKNKECCRKAWNSTAIAAAVAAVLWAAPVSVFGADLKPETLQQWDEYVKAVDGRNQEHLAPAASFISSAQNVDKSAKLRAGEIIVWPASHEVPLKVESGLIHDWIGAAFIPDTTLREMLAVLRDYDRYKQFYHPSIVQSKLIASSDSKDEFSVVLMNKSVVAKTALDSDYQTTYTQVDEHSWYSITDTTRIQEIADYDTPLEHMLPENHGTGLIWRLHSVTRFEERDGGVYIQLEAVALSRDIPAGLRWIIDPIVRRVSRSSMATSLRQTESAVRLYSASAMTSFNKSSASGIVRSFR
jgi:hypothetical protein